MRINSIAQYFGNNTLNPKVKKTSSDYKNNSLERVPQQDCISFSGIKPIDMSEVLTNPNSKNALRFAQNLIKDIYENAVCSLGTVAKVLHEQYPNVSVRPIHELANEIPNYQDYKAYLSSDIDSDFKVISQQMFLGLPKTADDIPDFISDAAHECTHISQELNSGEDTAILKKASGGDKKVAQTLRAIFDATFRVFDTNALMYSEKIKEPNGTDIISQHTDHIVKQLLTQMNNEEDTTHIKDVVAAYSDIDDLILDTKKYCAFRAKKEKEAYATEYAISVGLERNNSKNFELATEFFADLENAFMAK